MKWNPFSDDKKTRNMRDEIVQSYFDTGNKIAEVQGCFIMALEFSKRIYKELKCKHGNAKFFHKMIRQKLESVETILKTNEKSIPYDEYVTLEKMLEKQWKSYHDWQTIIQELDGKRRQIHD
jgi:hypothetical protein